MFSLQVGQIVHVKQNRYSENEPNKCQVAEIIKVDGYMANTCRVIFLNNNSTCEIDKGRILEMYL